MPISFQLDAVNRCVLASAESPLMDADLTQYQLALAAHPDHGPGFNQLVDLRDVNAGAVTSLGVRMAGSLTGRYAQQLAGTRCALVVSAGESFGLSRMFEAYASDVMEVDIFEDLEAAREWLGLEPPSGSGRLQA